MGLKAKLQEIVDQVEGTFGVAVKHLQTGEEAYINEHELFQLASVVKVPILATLYRDVEEGKVRLDERIPFKKEELVPGSGILQDLVPGLEPTVKDLATLMITVSDNYATDKILDIIGIDQVDQYMKELGFVNTHVKHSIWQLLCYCVGINEPRPYLEGYHEFRRKDMGGDFDSNHWVLEATENNNAASAADMNRLLEMIYKKEILSEAACEAMIDIMLRQKFTNRIPFYLPGTTEVACKSGSVGSAYNDIGIVFLPEDQGAFAISVLGRVKTPQVGQQIIAKVAKAAYDHFLNKHFFYMQN